MFHVRHIPLTSGIFPIKPLCMSTEDLLKDIDEFLEKSGMAETTFGRKSVNDGKAVGRLRSGKRMWPETINRIRQFIDAENSDAPASSQQPEARETA